MPIITSDGSNPPFSKVGSFGSKPVDTEKDKSRSRVESPIQEQEPGHETRMVNHQVSEAAPAVQVEEAVDLQNYADAYLDAMEDYRNRDDFLL